MYWGYKSSIRDQQIFQHAFLTLNRDLGARRGLLKRIITWLKHFTEVCPELEYVHRGSPGSLGSPNTFIEYI